MKNIRLIIVRISLQNSEDHEMRGNDDHPESMPFRGRRGGGRGGRGGGGGPGLMREKDENARAHRNDVSFC